MAMNVAGRVWLIRLSPLGKTTLKDVLSFSEQGTFEAHVIDEGERGIWVSPIEYHEATRRRSGLTTLIKWEYIATMQEIE